VASPLILVADDEPNIRETIAFILEMEGFTVATAADGETALAAVRARKPAVVLLDAMMPGQDGFEVCRRIKADEGLRSVRVIMLTALGQQADRERALTEGADCYMRKPFDEEELLALLRNWTTG
jgi:DNA-binding response OmpR family regulator